MTYVNDVVSTTTYCYLSSYDKNIGILFFIIVRCMGWISAHSSALTGNSTQMKIIITRNIIKQKYDVIVVVLYYFITPTTRDSRVVELGHEVGTHWRWTLPTGDLTASWCGRQGVCLGHGNNVRSHICFLSLLVQSLIFISFLTIFVNTIFI